MSGLPAAEPEQDTLLRRQGRVQELESSADGWRGRIGKEFTSRRALTVVRAILEERETETDHSASQILVGFDCRRLSEKVARLAASLISERPAEHKVTLVKHLPTSTASFLTSQEFDLAILVTASHNAADWNGIKVKVAPGVSASPDFVRRVDARHVTLPDRSVAPAQPATDLAASEPGMFLSRHARAVAAALPCKSGKRFRVSIDGLGGIAEPALARLGQSLGWQTLPSRRPVDADLCGHSPDPSRPSVLKRLCTRVEDETADFGLALDGDGDRIFAVTEKGEVVPTHDLMALLLLHQHHSDSPVRRIAITQSVGVSVRRAAASIGAEIVETPIGFKYISKLLSDRGVDAGVGAVGDIAFRAQTTDRDPLFVAAQLSQRLSCSDRPLSAEIEQLRVQFGTDGLRWIEHHFPNAGARTGEDLRTLLTDIAHIVNISPAGSETLVGGSARVRCNSAAWLMLRPSTTEGGLRLYGELLHANAQRQAALCDAIQHKLNSSDQGRQS